jgi:hypothetical protein
MTTKHAKSHKKHVEPPPPPPQDKKKQTVGIGIVLIILTNYQAEVKQIFNAIMVNLQ